MRGLAVRPVAVPPEESTLGDALREDDERTSGEELGGDEGLAVGADALGGDEGLAVGADALGGDEGLTVGAEALGGDEGLAVREGTPPAGADLTVGAETLAGDLGLAVREGTAPAGADLTLGEEFLPGGDVETVDPRRDPEEPPSTGLAERGSDVRRT